MGLAVERDQDGSDREDGGRVRQCQLLPEPPRVGGHVADFDDGRNRDSNLLQPRHEKQVVELTPVGVDVGLPVGRDQDRADG
jgi:hypothetical protein